MGEGQHYPNTIPEKVISAIKVKLEKEGINSISQLFTIDGFNSRPARGKFGKVTLYPNGKTIIAYVSFDKANKVISVLNTSETDII